MTRRPEPVLHCDVTVQPGAPIGRRREPISIGVPLPQGVCRDASALTLTTTDGTPTLSQTTPLNHWPDGSLRWVLLDFFADCTAVSPTVYRLVGSDGSIPICGIELIESASDVTVRTGRGIYRILPQGPSFLFISERPEHDAVAIRLAVTHDNGSIDSPTFSRVSIEDKGPLKASITLTGECGDEARHLFVEVRVTFWYQTAAARISVTLRNPRRASHPGGYWELGDPGSVLLKDVSLVATLPAQPHIACSPEPGLPLTEYHLPFEIVQHSSGGTRWNSSNHVNRDGHNPPSLRGYRVRSGSSETTGLRAQPVVRCLWTGGELAVTVPQFWQNFPRRIEVTDEALTVGLFPAQQTPHELQGGEQKTHHVMMAFGCDDVTDIPLDWARNPCVASASPRWYAATSAVPYLAPAVGDGEGAYLDLVNKAISGADSFFAKRELVDEYGWRNFGDLYADHEAVRHTGGDALISHYNNQYDAIKGFAVHFMRTRDVRWWQLFCDLAAHVVDVDIYHTTQDKSAYNGGMFWHTAHYVDAGKSTHRSYPRRSGVPGGGPANEHNYSSGLMLAYFLTGDRRYRDTVVGLAEWVLNMEDGRQTVFRWLDRGDTGLASMTRSRLYHGPGRGAAYSIDALLNAFTVTDDKRYLDRAELLIRRCIHPADDIDARDLLNAEQRWDYTVFMQTLARYLDIKISWRALDDMYAYGRTALVRYASWMADHEYPYLDKPELLEYPTETWAAQDLRKSEVFMHAARHCGGELHDRLRERATFFFSYAVETLSRSPTCGLSRPLVLILTNGYMRCWFLERADPAPEPVVGQTNFGRPKRFVPQRTRAMRRAAVVATLCAVVLIAGIVVLVAG